MSEPHANARAGDLAFLSGPRGHSLTIKLTPGERVQSMHGVIQHEDIIGREWGTQISTHLGTIFTILQPALDDLLRDIERASQVIYPKDIGYILLNLGVGPGTRVIEAGTGSGALTVALAHTVGEHGHVYSYETRDKAQALARQNLQHLGLEGRVTLHLQDIGDGFLEHDIPAIFLDLPNPEDYLAQVRAALQPGGFFGCILPTTNQVSKALEALKQHSFGFVEVSELMHRYYKASAGRLRPADTMVAHTGFLIFARRLAEGLHAEL
ncbi:MAG: tRNA (adenine-N1)-methyltransferase [Anaerolineales bacterium]|nr:tRNA (adenine-N1)-methyltransferase [Anaerolineales bacterium]